MNNIPKHVTLTLDGNRRWEKEQKLPPGSGHKAGFKNAIKITQELFDRDVEYVTLWALSHDNLKKRNSLEIAVIMKLLNGIEKYLEPAIARGIKIDFIGDLQEFPKKTLEVISRLKEKSKDNKKGTLILAINYGGLDEILRCMKEIITAGIDIDNVTQEDILVFSDTGKYPAPDLSIRTGGDSRTSGFFPITGGYAELYFTQTYWPAFDEKELDKAFNLYQNSKRNFGK